jgi:hypothetical protein
MLSGASENFQFQQESLMGDLFWRLLQFQRGPKRSKEVQSLPKMLQFRLVLSRCSLKVGANTNEPPIVKNIFRMLWGKAPLDESDL